MFSDNCSAQNKNKVLFQYLSAVVNTQSFNIKCIIHQYPEPGHSFLPCDRHFGHIEKARRKLETVYLPIQYETLVKDTNTIFFVIHVSQDMIFNFADYLTALCKKYVTNKEKSKLTIMAYRFVEYTADGIFCSVSGNSTNKENFVLEKSGQKLIIDDNNLQKLYMNPIKIKKAKFDDVNHLAVKYVPEEFQWFYRDLIVEDHPNIENYDSDFE